MYDMEKEELGAIREGAHTLDNGKSTNFVPSAADSFDINTVCPMQDNVLATGADDGVIKLWDKRFLDSTSKPIGCFLGHDDGIMSLDSTYNHQPTL